MNDDLVIKFCENPACNKTWKQLRKDTQKFHSKVCEEDFLKSNVIKKKRPGRPIRPKKESDQDNTTTPIKKELNKESEITTETKKQPMLAGNLFAKIDCVPGTTIIQNQQTKKDNMSETTIISTEKKNKTAPESTILIDQQLSLQELSNQLRTERSTTIEQLNFVGNCLLTNASSQKNQTDFINSLIEFRNIMRLKLDFMKFGVELTKSGEGTSR